MVLEDRDIEKINEVLGIKLTNWQTRFIRGESSWMPTERQTGKTTAFILYRLLTFPYDFTAREIIDNEDEFHGAQYHRIYRQMLLRTANILEDNGFEIFLKGRW